MVDRLTTVTVEQIPCCTNNNLSTKTPCPSMDYPYTLRGGAVSPQFDRFMLGHTSSPTGFSRVHRIQFEVRFPAMMTFVASTIGLKSDTTL